MRLAPIPMPSDATAATISPGDRASARQASRALRNESTAIRRSASENVAICVLPSSAATQVVFRERLGPNGGRSNVGIVNAASCHTPRVDPSLIVMDTEHPPPPTSADDAERYRPRLFGIAYRMLSDVQEAEDLVQETFLRWHRAKHDDVVSEEGWLFAVITRPQTSARKT